MRLKPNKAFTIVELLVAMALVVILVGLSSLIFAAGVKAFRAADSTVEVVRRAESITRQLDADIAALQTGAPLAVWFERIQVGTEDDGITPIYRHYDQILFFANGNFQTMRQTSTPAGFQTVRGNMARVYYGHAWRADLDSNVEPWAWTNPTGKDGYRWFSQDDPGVRLLSRRVHLLTSEMTLLPMTMIGYPFPNPDEFTAMLGDFSRGQFVPYWNNRLEYDQLSLVEWKNLMRVTGNCNQLLLRAFSNERDAYIGGRPMIDMENADTLHLLMSENISEFKIQWAYRSEDLYNAVSGTTFLPNQLFSGIRWWPEQDNDDFAAMGMNRDLFGIYFNMPGGETLTEWFPVSAGRTTTIPFSPSFFPKAIKITFTVHDTKGMFPDGKVFTQIVTIN